MCAHMCRRVCFYNKCANLMNIKIENAFFFCFSFVFVVVVYDFKKKK